MEKVYKDDVIMFHQYSLDTCDDIFDFILKERENRHDSNRFFLELLSKDEASKYNFADSCSIESFRNAYLSINSPLKLMGGCNMNPTCLSEDIRYAGIKMSDPSGRVSGSFDIRNEIITYSPIFPHFYDERDLCKFANDSYFTTMSFEDIMLAQINRYSDFYVHVGDYSTLKDIHEHGRYILERVSKEEMIEYVNNPDSGAEVYKKYLNRNNRNL